MTMNWQEYEAEIFKELRRRYPEGSITLNAMLPGRFSETNRQIDVLIEAQLLDAPIRIIVDAKKHAVPIDVKDVESFISMMADVAAHRGILISSSGYTKGAIARAHREVNQDLELDVYTLEELKKYQGAIGFPFSGTRGVLLEAPFGWVIDQRGFIDAYQTKTVACLYQRGYDFHEAKAANEFMYLNFWHKDSQTPDLDGLLKIQEKTLSSGVLTYLSGVARSDAQTKIRLAEVPGYPAPEYTGFVEFDDFIFFVVLFTTPEMSKRNLRKLREILRTVVPIEVRHDR